jgi:toxin ParE1/3/4
MRIRWTPAAAGDLEQIARYLQEHNPTLAESTVQMLYDAVQSLKQFPNRGRIGRVAGTRELIHSSLPYIIVYQVEQQTVQVVRVVHGAEDWP